MLRLHCLSPAQSHTRARDCGLFAEELALSSPLLLELRLHALHASKHTLLCPRFDRPLKRCDRAPDHVHLVGLINAKLRWLLALVGCFWMMDRYDAGGTVSRDCGVDPFPR